MRRVTVAVFATLALTLTAPPALAAKPVSRACFGGTISGHAMAGSFGALVSETALANRGVNVVVHTIQAGAFPDAGFPNTCND